MAQELHVHTIADDLSVYPSTNTEMLTTTCYSRQSDALFWTPWTPAFTYA